MNLEGKRSGSGDPVGKDRRKSLGRAGEVVARVYLEKDGYRILGENFRKRGGEIDLVVAKGKMLVFVEVKTRSDRDPVDLAIDTYTEAQMNRLAELSEAWMHENEDVLPGDFDLRYDLVIVGSVGDGELEVKEHIADAFRPG